MAKLTKEQIVESLRESTLLEINDLVKAIEEAFGVTAAVVVAGGAAPVEEEKPAEKTAFNVFLKAVGPNKVQVIKAVQAITGLGLMDAKKLVDAAPGVVKENVPTADANDAKTKLTDAGAEVELQ